MDENMIISITFLSIFIVLGIVLIVNAILKLKMLEEVKKWPSTDGVIIDSKIVTSDVRGGILLPACRLKVRYEYSVNKKIFTGDRIGVSKTKYESLIRERIEELALIYKVENIVIVYFNPKRHDQALLDRDVTPYQYLKIIIQIIFGFVLSVASTILFF